MCSILFIMLMHFVYHYFISKFVMRTEQHGQGGGGAAAGPTPAPPPPAPPPKDTQMAPLRRIKSCTGEWVLNGGSLNSGCKVLTNVRESQGVHIWGGLPVFKHSWDKQATLTSEYIK